MQRNEQLYLALKELGVIEEKRLTEIYNEVKNTKELFHSALLKHDLITEENLCKLESDIFGYPYINLKDTSISPDALSLVTEAFARANQLVVYALDDQTVSVAITVTTPNLALDLIHRKTGKIIRSSLATQTDLTSALRYYIANPEETFQKIISTNISEATHTSAEPPIIRIVDTILQYAYQNRASDIHLEPENDSSLVRFRIDGVLHDIVKLPINLHTSIITRIKVLSKLRTDEHQSAQDGKMKYNADTEDVDIRVSIVPITEGEKVVMRLLAENALQFSLSDLGFQGSNLDKVKTAYAKPFGMVLATGPTGSGKTTTMYALLKLLNTRDVNIMTIEDPVEYQLEGINQIQVNPLTNLTFASGLKSILRQDPNVVLVGEIRDSETASIAVNAALTGHLVLSTLHTNDATTTIPRLIEMGIEPFLIGSTVNIVIAQRLVRTIHSACRVSEEIAVSAISNDIPKELIEKTFSDQKKIRIYKGKGCEACHNTGYSGRIGIYEILVIEDSLREAIVARKDAATLKKIAIKEGMVTMMEDGIIKAREGITTLEEVLRVTTE